MNRRSPLLAVVLAAGNSRRFGSDKRFATTPSGNSLLHATLLSLSGHVNAICVAVGMDDVIDAKWPARVGERKVHYFRAPRSAEGMGCTLSDVVRQLPHGCDFLVALADMPFIRQETIGRLVARFSLSNKPAPIVFPLWVASAAPESAVNGPEYGAGHRGHPVIFHRSYREELGGLAGERGAGCIVAAYPAAHEPVEVNDTGVIADVDRPDDLRHP